MLKVVFMAAMLFAATTLSLTARAEAIPATGSIEPLFTPWDDVEGAIIRALAQAQKTIHVQTYLLTSRPITQALIAAKNRGIDITVLADREMVRNGKSSKVSQLVAAGIPVYLETRYAVAHNKIILIDAQTSNGILLTGSYNFTWSAQARNAENLLIIRNNPRLLQRYFANWQRHQEESQPYATLTEATHES